MGRRRVGKGARGGPAVADVVLAVWFALSLGLAVAGWFVPVDSTSTVGISYEAPSAQHVLGTDNLGRDVLARVLHGGMQLLGVALVSTAAATAAGVALGFLLTGRGAVARVLGSAVDLLVVLPSMLVMMVLVYGLGAGVGTMVCVTTVVTAPYIARYTRAVVEPVLSSDYVASARLSGDPLWLVAVRDVLPNIALPLATDTGQRFISAVYLVASAAFLGFDPLGSSSDWATMIQSCLAGLALNPWGALAPTIALACVTVSGNLLVDRLGKRGEL